MSRRAVAGHGTHACYRSGCRRAECTSAAVRADAERQLDRLAGRPRLVPTTIVIPHVEKLWAHGLRNIDIIRAAGLEGHNLNTVLKQKKINRATANKLLSVPLNHKPSPPLVCGVGTIRRVQALYALGYSGAEIGRGIHLTAAAVWRLAHEVNTQVKVPTDVAVRALYGRLCTVPGKSLKARNMALRNGWHGPLAWDDIDDPNAQPESDATEPDAEVSKRELFLQLAEERRTEIRLLASAGNQPAQIAQRVGLSEQTVRRTLANNHPALYLELTA